VLPRPRQAHPYVLIVEDDAQLRELYQSALRGAGFAVVAVEDGLTALRHLDMATPAAVVLDLDLPRVRGLDVHQELRAAPVTEHVPVVVVTGQDTADLDLTQFACVLRKPIYPDQIVSAVERCLRAAAERADHRH
jgi:two-component system phosphate regulon response regulator PhoB